MRKFLIDTDTASDDAVALVLAAMHPDVVIEAVTVVAGNVPLVQGVQNALYTLELCDKAVPVYPGCAKPMLRIPATAQTEHGSDGMGDIGLPLRGRTPADGHAVDVLLDKTRQHAGEITLVTLGPLTNVAVALLRDPGMAQRVERCVIMGGIGSDHGNVTPVAEYNIWCDPEAARIVFDSGMKITMVGWDISWKYATLTAEEVAAIHAIDTPLAHFCMDIQRQIEVYSREVNHLDGFDLPDPIAMAVALDPSIAAMQEYYVEVTLGEGLYRGQTVVDKLGVMGKTPNVSVITHADHVRFMEMLRAAVSLK